MVEPDAPLGPRLLSQIPQIHKLYWILIVLGCVLSGPVTCLPHPLAHGSADAFSIQLDDSNHLQLQQEFSKFHISQNASAYWANSGKLNSSLDFDRSQMTQFTGTFYPPLTPSLTGGKKSQPTTTTLRPTQTPSLPELPEIYLNGTQFHLPHQQNMTTKWMECLFGLVTCVECTLTPQPVTTEEELEAYTNELVECRLAFGFVSYQGLVLHIGLICFILESPSPF